VTPLVGISTAEFLADSANADGFIATTAATIGHGVSVADITIVNVSDSVLVVRGRRAALGSGVDVDWEFQYISEQVGSASGATSVNSTASSLVLRISTAVSDGSFASNLASKSPRFINVTVVNAVFSEPVALVVRSPSPTAAPSIAPSPTPTFVPTAAPSLSPTVAPTASNRSSGIDALTYAMYGGIAGGALALISVYWFFYRRLKDDDEEKFDCVLRGVDGVIDEYSHEKIKEAKLFELQDQYGAESVPYCEPLPVDERELQIMEAECVAL
jgi:hypothetical protein